MYSTQGFVHVQTDKLISLGFGPVHNRGSYRLGTPEFADIGKGSVWSVGF